MNWEYIKTGHYVLKHKDYTISFNTMETVAGMSETAICVKDEFFILYGDHRKMYETCKSLKECLQKFIENKQIVSFWSSPVSLAEQMLKEC